MNNKKISLWLGIGIFITPLFYSWFTLKGGYSKQTQIIAFAWLAVVATFATPALALAIFSVIIHFFYKSWQLAQVRIEAKKEQLAIMNDEESGSIVSNDYYEPDSDDDYEYHASKPIPADDRKRITLNNEDYYIAWSGQLPETSFTVNRNRITISPTHILVKQSATYLADTNNDDETIIIKTKDISTMLATIGHKKFDIWDWFINVPGVPDDVRKQYPDYESYDSDYIDIWEGEAPNTSFGYNSDKGRVKLNVIPLKIRRGKLSGDLTLGCSIDGKKDVINMQRIDTMLTTDGYKKVWLDDWIKDILPQYASSNNSKSKTEQLELQS
nr:hypothetical protein [Moritella viscosa]SHO06904.1 Putative uncharacterized protein [Moritella viscosa]